MFNLKSSAPSLASFLGWKRRGPDFLKTNEMIKYKWLWPKYEKGGGILRQFCSIKNFETGSQATVFDWISWFFFAGSVFNRYPRIRREIKNYQKMGQFSFVADP